MIMLWWTENFGLLGLSALQRFDAMRQMSSDFLTDRLFIIGGSAAIGILTVLFFIVGKKRKSIEEIAGLDLFANLASRRGLTSVESQLLSLIARKAGLKQAVSIFNLEKVFNRTAKRMLEQLADQNKNEENARLQSRVSVLREKLGFSEESSMEVTTAKEEKLTSRQIGKGERVFVSCRKNPQSGEVEAEILESNSDDFVVALAKSINITFGDSWCVRYYSGAALWEFDTTPISYDGGILALNHCDQVRCINRRRFVRVPLKRDGFIAEFPFERILAGRAVNGKTLQLPEFHRALITELGGPGLRVESPVKMNKGQRVIVAFSLLDNEKTQTRQVVEDIGEVRNVRACKDGFSMAIELTGLTDSNIAELVRATNSNLIRQKRLSDEIKTKVQAMESVGV